MRFQPDPAMWARFDDLTSGRALTFSGPHRVVAAWSPAEVVSALAAVDTACAGGAWAAGFVAYEAAAGLDPTLPVRPAESGQPLVWFGLVDNPPADARAIEAGAGAGHSSGPWRSDWDESTHAAAVRKVREHIAAGQTYQVNLTTRLRATSDGDPLSLYATLAHAQRGAFNAYLDTGRTVVASASPELFFSRQRDRVVMRPMKGTAGRGPTTASDAVARTGLLESLKERAENVMIVDLVRNDLARVATIGGVEVTQLLDVESYPTVHQLTSQVEADLRDGIDLVGLFTALFPCGSVTGAPKASTMSLIAELEDAPRGVYCGAVGMVGPPGAPIQARFSVAIRTAVVDRLTGRAVYGVGGGITWSSEPAAEHTELRHKARILRTQHEDFELVETMRHDSVRGLRSWPEHRARLLGSAGYLGFALNPARIEDALREALSGVGDARVRLRCARNGRVTIDLGALPAPRAVARVVVDEQPVDETSWLVHHKTSLRAPYDERLARHPEADDVLMVNSRGELTESCRANVAVRLDGVWWTPPLGDGCLPGVARAVLVRTGQFRERVLMPADLKRAEEFVLVSSLRGREEATILPSEAQDGAAFG